MHSGWDDVLATQQDAAERRRLKQKERSRRHYIANKARKLQAVVNIAQATAAEVCADMIVICH